jgi:hypothetical protein
MVGVRVAEEFSEAKLTGNFEVCLSIVDEARSFVMMISFRDSDEY